MTDLRAATDASPESGAAAGEPPAGPRWPRTLIDLARACRQGDGPTGSAPPRELSELWTILNTVLRQRILAASRRVGPIGAEDLEDLASDRALELIRRFDEGRWKLADATPRDVVRFLSAVARNALVDHLRRGSRWRTAPPEASDREAVAAGGRATRVEAPDTAVLRRDFARTVMDCLRKLTETQRRIWYLRVLLEMPSREVAHHPAIRRSIGNVDVTQGRCRKRIRECVQRCGLEPRDMPPGTFAELWRMLGAPVWAAAGRTAE